MPDFNSDPMSQSGSSPFGASSPILGEMSPMISGDSDRKTQLANSLYQDAMKMQQDAQELLRMLQEQTDSGFSDSYEEPEETSPIRPMSAPVAEAANSALIGGGFPRR